MGQGIVSRIERSLN